MNRAHDAVLRAENNADAVAFAPDTLVHARDALVRMQTEADARRFNAAGNFADEAISLAEQAIAEGMLGARSREDAARLLEGLAGQVRDTDAAVTAARNQALLLDHNALRREMDTTRLLYEDAVRNLQVDNIQDAVAQGQTVRSNLADINAQLLGAAHAISRK